VHYPPSVAGSFAYCGGSLLPVVVVPEKRECLSVEGYHWNDVGVVGFVRVSSDDYIFLAHQ
jgi:hypothetical protein